MRDRMLLATQLPADTLVNLPSAAETWSWSSSAGFPHALDFFGDGSLYIIDSPGHLYGHVNLLARADDRRYIYLGGDCRHDPRILAGEKRYRHVRGWKGRHEECSGGYRDRQGELSIW